MLTLNVLYFAHVRERVGTAREAVVLPVDSTVADAIAAIVARHPAVSPLLSSLRVALDGEFVGPDVPLHDGAELVLIPPVSGGSGTSAVLLTDAPLDAALVQSLVSSPSHGGIALFIGQVRDHARGQAVSQLEYEAYPSMALAQMRRIVAEVEAATREPEYATVRRVIAIWLRAALRRNRKSPILLPELDDLQELKIMLSQRIEKWAKEFEAEGEKKGRMEGRMEGEVRMLERQLTRRFGELPSWIRQRLSSASEAQLEHWSEAVLDAESLTAIFGEPPSRH